MGFLSPSEEQLACALIRMSPSRPLSRFLRFLLSFQVCPVPTLPRHDSFLRRAWIMSIPGWPLLLLTASTCLSLFPLIPVSSLGPGPLINRLSHLVRVLPSRLTLVFELSLSPHTKLADHVFPFFLVRRRPSSPSTTRLLSRLLTLFAVSDGAFTRAMAMKKVSRCA